MARRRRAPEDERWEVLAAQAASGLSLLAFAPAAGVPYWTLLSWRSRAARAMTFVPVEIESPPEVESSCGAVVDGRLEIVVGGAVVRVGRDFDDVLLTRVVRALRAC